MSAEDKRRAADLFRGAKRMLRGNAPQWREYINDIKAAAKLGHAEAQEHLGAWYLAGMREDNHGWILRRSPKQAVHWLALAAHAGNPSAVFTLATCYASGTGVPANPAEALRLYRKALRKGIHTAAHQIALVYRDTGNRRAQERWLVKAADLGDWNARLALQQLRFSHGQSEAKQLQAIRELKRIATRAPDPEHRKEAVRLLTAIAGG
jgi:TPR repeat protein